jgi:hypothetical protein
VRVSERDKERKRETDRQTDRERDGVKLTKSGLISLGITFSNLRHFIVFREQKRFWEHNLNGFIPTPL